MSTLLAQKEAAPWLLRPATAEGVISNGHAQPMAASLTGGVAVRAVQAAPETEPVKLSGDPLADEMWLAYMEPLPERPAFPTEPELPPTGRVFNPTFSEVEQRFTHPGVDVQHLSVDAIAAWRLTR
jgi:hypothetical protein